MKQTFSILSFILFSFSFAHAQQAQKEFGKNRIQYRQFKWEYLSSSNFDVYYYDNRRKLTNQVIIYLEKEFERITDLIGYSPNHKSKIFLYNSIMDLQQSNVGLYHTQLDIGGETEFVKPYAEIAHTGSMEGFKKELIFKVSQMMINEMMFGGNLKNMFKNAILLSLPDWFIAGAARYIAYGWDASLDDYARQLTGKRNAKKISRLTGNEATLVGQTIWNYIAEKYGEKHISNILNYTRVIRNERKSILITLGTSYRKMIHDWKYFYTEAEVEMSNHYIYPEDSTRIKFSNKKNLVYTAIKISPEGTKIAYAENDRGVFIIRVKSLINNKEIVVLRDGHRFVGQEINDNIPLISWKDQNVLGVIGTKRGVCTFWLYDLETKTKISRPLPQFSNVKSFDVSDNGRLAVLSADSKGQNDLFLISTRRDRTRRLTNDLYDDIDPSFFPLSNKIIFSSNRTTDTVNTVVKKIDALSNFYDIYLFDLDSTKNVVKKITNTATKKYHPSTNGKGSFYYVSDHHGIPNIFRYDQSDNSYTQITRFRSSVKTYDLNFSTQRLTFILKTKLKEGVFTQSDFNLFQSVITPPNKRREALRKRNLEENQRKKKMLPALSLKELVSARLQEKEASSTVHSDSTEKKEDALDRSTKNPEEPIKTIHYKFKDENEGALDNDMFFAKYIRDGENYRIDGPFPYRPRFIYNSTNTSLIVFPLKGFGFGLGVQMNDVLENYRFFGGITSTFDFKNGTVYGEAQYLPHRIDYSVRVERRAIVWDEISNTNMYTWQKIELGASLPISTRWRFTVKPFIGYSRYLDQGLITQNINGPSPPVFLSEQIQGYVGYKTDLIYDDSISTGINAVEGTKGKISFTHYGGINNENANFMHAYIDLRRHQKIYRNIILAARGYVGHFFGSAPKKYALGGTENWIRLPSDFSFGINRNGRENPFYRADGFNDDVIFTEYGTLRGFDYASTYGNSLISLNVELRIPIFRTLAAGPISSSFFKNFQFIGFFDAGTSWLGPLISSENNSPSRFVPEGQNLSPFQIEVKDLINPWLYSFGAGLRAKILGFYWKFDVAWAVENYQIKRSPRGIFSIGFDF